LQYLHQALQAPVARQEVISNGPLFVKVKIHPQIPFRWFIIYLNVSLQLKKDCVVAPVFVFSGKLAHFSRKFFVF